MCNESRKAARTSLAAGSRRSPQLTLDHTDTHQPPGSRGFVLSSALYTYMSLYRKIEHMWRVLSDRHHTLLHTKSESRR
jgi:hypothetical protein